MGRRPSGAPGGGARRAGLRPVGRCAGFRADRSAPFHAGATPPRRLLAAMAVVAPRPVEPPAQCPGAGGRAALAVGGALCGLDDLGLVGLAAGTARRDGCLLLSDAASGQRVRRPPGIVLRCAPLAAVQVPPLAPPDLTGR